uniref:Putative ABC transport system, ATPase component n=1 Tax=Magnetococcus massalia (strain MO-1) TaxID=451514 RepID=A0A1S7LFU0_MAGMO|nr:Putative ABC transport system, ATPase component [Candidatus Magnetococcus massalia]
MDEMMAEQMIKIEALSRSYGSVKALDGIDLDVAKGEVVGFLGPNGAGKSTTMRILAGLLAPTEGRVTIGGVDVVAQPEVARRKIGYLPETPPIYDELSVREYLTHLAALRRVPRKACRAAVDEAMARCGLLEVAERLLRNLSKGYRQRAGIAQAIVHRPDVVILDEPTVGLDPIQIREIRQLIRELGDQHAVLLSTHILPEVKMTCDRVALINAGAIVMRATMAELESRFQQRGEYLLRFAPGPERDALQQIAGVASVTPDGEEGWRMLPDEGADPLPELLRHVVEQGWNLRELRPVGESLEELFLNLTTREEGVDSEAQMDHSAGEAA